MTKKRRWTRRNRHRNVAKTTENLKRDLSRARKIAAEAAAAAEEAALRQPGGD